MDLNPRQNVDHVGRVKVIPNQVHIVERIVRLRQDFFGRLIRILRINGDHASIGRIQIGLEIEYGAIVSKDAVFVFNVRNQFHKRRLGSSLQIPVNQRILVSRRFPDGKGQILPILGDEKPHFE